MTIGFCDASALVKRYVPESGGEELAVAEVLVASVLSRVEVTSAIRCKERLGEIGRPEASLLCDVVDQDFDDAAALVIVALSSDLLRDASVLLGKHELRAGDAVQLASAMHVRARVPECSLLLCFDARLRTAAAQEGFAVHPPDRA